MAVVQWMTVRNCSGGSERNNNDYQKGLLYDLLKVNFSFFILYRMHAVASPGNEVMGDHGAQYEFFLPCPGFFLVPRIF